MKKEKISSLMLLAAIIILAVACRQAVDTVEQSSKPALNEMIPRVLILTSGLNDENIHLPAGILIALQTFNQAGAYVRLETRKILHDTASLHKYNILILSTAPGYHDADRKYSLSYMSDAELQHIADFVRAGGVVIAGDNIGRNMADGTDRIVVYGKLKTDTWILADCFGVILEEKNMFGYGISGMVNHTLSGYFRPALDEEVWTLVADTMYSPDAEMLAYWHGNGDTLPAIVRNRYGKGTSYLLATSDFLHPAGEGGIWSSSSIGEFYHEVLADFLKYNKIGFTLNPWPQGFDNAFALTFNSQGTLEEHERVLLKTKEYEIDPVFFVNGIDSPDTKKYLLGQNLILASNGFAFRNYKNIEYPDALSDIASNEAAWGKAFKGFRFPFTSPGYWGFYTLDERGYSYVSTIGVNNLEFRQGSVFPYNIVISNGRFYKSTNLLEVGPVYHDDYFFLKMAGEEKADPRKLADGIRLYAHYLTDYWERAVKPMNGAMIYLGHPSYVGYNDSTITALDTLLAAVKKDHTWIATLDEIVEYRKALADIIIHVENIEGVTKIHVDAPSGLSLEGLTLNVLPETGINGVSSTDGSARLEKTKNGKQLVFKAFNGQVLEVR